MIKPIALTAAGISAAVVLTVGLVAAGFGPRPAVSNPAGTEVPAAPPMAVSPTAEPTLGAEIVYVKPAPAPKTVVVERQTATRNTAAIRSSSQTRPVRAERQDDDRDEREDDDRDEREDHDEYERGDD